MYGIDVYDTGLMISRPWRWLQIRIWDLLETPSSRLYRALFSRDGGE